jgi:acetoin utilization protein AcuB
MATPSPASQAIARGDRGRKESIMLVREYMIDKVVSVHPETGLHEARRLMRKYNVRRLPVVVDGRLVGIVTDRDLRQASPSPATTLSVHELNYLLDKLEVREIMSKPVITVIPSAPLEEAARLMREHKIGGLPVVEEGKVVGMITEVDVLGVLIRALGWGEQGTRLEIEADDRPGVLAEIASIMQAHGANITSVLTAPQRQVGRVQMVMRLKTTSPDPLVAALEKAGFTVLTTIVL